MRQTSGYVSLSVLFNWLIILFTGWMNIHRVNRLKLNPLGQPTQKYLTPVKKQERSFSQFVSKQIARYKTETDQQIEPIFPFHVSAERKVVANSKDSKKEYEAFRQLQLRKNFESRKLPKRKHQIKLVNKVKSSTKLMNLFEDKIQNRQQMQNVNKVKVEDLQKNVLHLADIFSTLNSKSEPKQLIQAVKRYILEQESDLNQLQHSYQDQRSKWAVKQIIFNERVLLLLLIQSLLYRRFKQNEPHFQQLFKQLFYFYSLLYLQFTSTSLLQILNQKSHKQILPHLNHNLSPFSLISVKDSFSKRMSFVSKQFGQIDRFIARQIPKLRDVPTNLMYYNLLEFYAGRLAGNDWSGWGIQFLQTCPSPYLHYPTHHKYTLLLDLDQTLVHYRTTSSTKGQFLLRPHLFDFLKKVQQLFQVGIFTCGLKDYADLILQHLPGISLRLYRQHAVRIGRELVKDLSRVGRQLSKVILVDNLQKNFRLQKQNGIHVRSWYGDPNDTILRDLGVQLQKIALIGSSDLRESDHKKSFL